MGISDACLSVYQPYKTRLTDSQYALAYAAGGKIRARAVMLLMCRFEVEITVILKVSTSILLVIIRCLFQYEYTDNAREFCYARARYLGQLALALNLSISSELNFMVSVKKCLNRSSPHLIVFRLIETMSLV